MRLFKFRHDHLLLFCFCFATSRNYMIIVSKRLIKCLDRSNYKKFLTLCIGKIFSKVKIYKKLWHKLSGKFVFLKLWDKTRKKKKNAVRNKYNSENRPILIVLSLRLIYLKEAKPNKAFFALKF